jgi:hypothetical protein
VLQGTGTAGGSFKRRPWLKMGCCADDDDDDDDDDLAHIFLEDADQMTAPLWRRTQAVLTSL